VVVVVVLTGGRVVEGSPVGRVVGASTPPGPGTTPPAVGVGAVGVGGTVGGAVGAGREVVVVGRAPQTESTVGTDPAPLEVPQTHASTSPSRTVEVDAPPPLGRNTVEPASAR
jgi:hypothetical protein